MFERYAVKTSEKANMHNHSGCMYFDMIEGHLSTPSVLLVLVRLCELLLARDHELTMGKPIN